MRTWSLRKKDSLKARDSAMSNRGRILDKDIDDSGMSDYEEYEVEVGLHCTFSSEMFSLCVMHDEIIEFFKNDKSCFGKLIYKAYLSTVKEIDSHQYAIDDEDRDPNSLGLTLGGNE